MKKSHFSFLLALCSTFLLAPGAALNTQAKAEIDQGIYEISSAVSTDFVLDVKHCTFHDTDSQALQLYYALDVNQQKFYFETLPGGVYRINALHSGEALSSGEQSSICAPVYTEQVQRTGGRAVQKHQSWILEDAGDGTYYIRSRAGKYLTLDASGAYLGAPVELRNFSGKNNQKWILEESWISSEDCADTDLINPYGQDGAYDDLLLTIEIGDFKETLTSDDLSSWMTETEEHELILDDTQFTAYVEKLAEKYNTKGHPRTFVTSGGSEITLYKGTYGWEMDVAETAAAIEEASKQSGRVTIEPVWNQKAASLERGSDIGDSYVEVSLTEQKVWLYIDGEQILETDCVSGTYGTSRQTPGGVYFIYYRQSPAVLRGGDYESPVQYWMAYNGGIGLHDANWRSTFGGDIYLSNGSHGCVNLPTDAARTIYENTKYGFPVVSYN